MKVELYFIRINGIIAVRFRSVHFLAAILADFNGIAVKIAHFSQTEMRRQRWRKKQNRV